MSDPTAASPILDEMRLHVSTEPYKVFWKEATGILESTIFIGDLLLITARTAEPVDPDSPGYILNVFAKHERRLTEMHLSRAVDNFLTYISDLLQLILEQRPNMLPDSDTEVRLRDILKHESKESLVKEIIERKVYSLSRKGIRELNAYLERFYGLTLIKDKVLDKVADIIATRNIITHNRGIINALFCLEVPTAESQIGKPHSLKMTDFTVLSTPLIFIAEDLDKRAIDKFGLPASTYTPPPVVQ